MLPEGVKAIAIADKHLAGETPERRLALAKDIVKAINEHAEALAMDAINDAVSATRNKH